MNVTDGEGALEKARRRRADHDRKRTLQRTLALAEERICRGHERRDVL
jgi:hypothetical protein